MVFSSESMVFEGVFYNMRNLVWSSTDLSTHCSYKGSKGGMLRRRDNSPDRAKGLGDPNGNRKCLVPSQGSTIMDLSSPIGIADGNGILQKPLQ